MSRGLKQKELYEGLFRSIDQRFGMKDTLPVLDWIEKASIVLDGHPVDFSTHHYQTAPIAEEAPRQCAMKGAQVGFTSIYMLKSVHGLIHGNYPQGVLYLFPTRDDVVDFSKGRFQPLIHDNQGIARFVQETDAANIKRIGSSMLYFRGARATRSIGNSKKTSSQLKSVPVDRIVFDEVDEMEPAMIDLALERISHSTIKEEVYLSTPTIPDFGVDALFQKSDQNYWHIKCEACGGWTCLELTFPDCLIETSDGRVIRACSKCKREIDPRNGKWVPARPGLSDTLVGWNISQLCSLFVDPKKILEAYRFPPNGRLQEFYNSKLARAYIEAVNRLSLSQVLALCGSDGIASSDQGPCSLGVDQGSNLHVVIGKRHPGRAGRIVHIGIYKDWTELDGLMRSFNVFRCVVDALPETRNARAFAERFKGKVYLNFYNPHQKGAYAWRERDLVVSSNRTESLDASHNQILNADLVLPKECEITRQFALHLQCIAKRLETDKETGSQRYVYVRLGPDHFRHAFNYECMARGTFAKALFPEFL